MRNAEPLGNQEIAPINRVETGPRMAGLIASVRGIGTGASRSEGVMRSAVRLANREIVRIDRGETGLNTAALVASVRGIGTGASRSEDVMRSAVRRGSSPTDPASHEATGHRMAVPVESVSLTARVLVHFVGAATTAAAAPGDPVRDARDPDVGRGADQGVGRPRRRDAVEVPWRLIFHIK
jgi:hypothetical protein